MQVLKLHFLKRFLKCNSNALSSWLNSILHITSTWALGVLPSSPFLPLPAFSSYIGYWRYCNSRHTYVRTKDTADTERHQFPWRQKEFSPHPHSSQDNSKLPNFLNARPDKQHQTEVIWRLMNVGEEVEEGVVGLCYETWHSTSTRQLLSSNFFGSLRWLRWMKLTMF